MKWRLLSARFWIGVFILSVGVGVVSLMYQQQQQSQQVVKELSLKLSRTLTELDQLHQVVQHQHNEKNWVLDEVNYLVSLAHLRLHFLQDVDTALAALEAAESHLAQLQDTSLLPLRQQLAHDIGILKTTARVDRESIALRLEALAHSLEQLPLSVTPVRQAEEVPAADQANDWREALQQAWLELRSLIRIRHHDGAQLVPILDVSDRQRLQQMVLTIIAQAKWAVLNHQVAIYQESLKTLLNSIPLFLSVNDAQRASLEAEIQSLAAIDIAPLLPALTLTREAVRKPSAQDGSP